MGLPRTRARCPAEGGPAFFASRHYQTAKLDLTNSQAPDFTVPMRRLPCGIKLTY